MTAAQQETLDQIKKLMREHFETAIFIYETEDENNATTSELEYSGVGSFASSIGLVRVAEAKMMSAIHNPPEEE